MGKLIASIGVRYKYADGWHVFQSDEVHGLYVANRDAKISYDDVKVAIEKLIFLNEGINCIVQPGLTFEEFISCLKGENSSEENIMQAPIMSNKRYLVHAPA